MNEQEKRLRDIFQAFMDCTVTKGAEYEKAWEKLANLIMDIHEVLPKTDRAPIDADEQR